MRALFQWVEDRTGIGGLVHEALYERVPGGARWRYVWGSTLVFAFTVQMITGIFLWMAYSPSSQTAWESVYYIQHEMYFGWLLRGLHHYMASTMIVLLVLHLMQVVIDGAYRAPREFNFWLGLILMKITLGLALTGYLLPWDQRGYWSTGVATSLMSLVPVVGAELQKLVVGGSEYGHHTLTRFFALHAGVLPGLLILFLVLHIAIFRKHGIHPKKVCVEKDCYFWPDQVLKDGVACLAVLCAVLFMVAMPVFLGHVDMETVKADPGSHLGAHLTAPADPSNKFSAARPEWYFLFLFQFLKFFHGEDGERIGALYIPGALMGVLFLMPIIGRWKLGHRFNVAFLCVMLVGAGLLTLQAWYDDNMAANTASVIGKVPGFTPTEEKIKASEDYLRAVEQADDEAHRIVELVRRNQGVPPTGAVSLLRNDPATQGPILFAQHCASCHNYQDATGVGIVCRTPTAPNLYDFASRAWIGRLLDPKQVDGPDMFGNTAHSGATMSSFVKDDLPGLVKENGEKSLEQLIKALSAEASLPKQAALDKQEEQEIAAGRKLIESFTCTDCHKFGDIDNEGGAPDLTGYGSTEWLQAFISNPGHARFYGNDNDKMPAFYNDPENPQNNKLTERDLEMLVEWLRSGE